MASSVIQQSSCFHSLVPLPDAMSLTTKLCIINVETRRKIPSLSDSLDQSIDHIRSLIKDMPTFFKAIRTNLNSKIIDCENQAEQKSYNMLQSLVRSCQLAERLFSYKLCLSFQHKLLLGSPKLTNSRLFVWMPAAVAPFPYSAQIIPLSQCNPAI